jgi:hypothetical protein
VLRLQPEDFAVDIAEAEADPNGAVGEGILYSADSLIDATS